MKPKNFTPLTDAFLDNLKTKMHDLKVTKTKLSQFLEIPKQSVNRYFHEAKSRKPTGEIILKMQEFIKRFLAIFL